MAGRPLRRLRMNPLVGWENTSGFSSTKDVLPEYAPLLIPGAEAKYAQVYTKVDLPIVVALRPIRSDGSGRKSTNETEKDEEVARRLNALVLSVALPPRERAKDRLGGLSLGLRGHYDRGTPFTAFTLLHRIGDTEGLHYLYDAAEKDAKVKSAMKAVDRALDKMEGASGLHLFYNRDEYERLFVEYWAEVFSRGVDTAAGRLGALVHEQALNDLFAKYLLTGRVAYDPVNPPSQLKGEHQYRMALAKGLPVIFEAWAKEIKANLPLVMNVGGMI